MGNSLRKDLDGASTEQQLLAMALSREDLAADLDGYATEQWVLSKKYLTKKDLPDCSPPADPSPEQPAIDPEHEHDEYAPVAHKHEYLELTGGDLSGYLGIKVPSQIAFVVKKANEQTLKIWADGGVDTTKTSFKEDQLVPRRYTDATYAPTGHSHDGLAADIADLQEGFDEAVLAAQEGAENIELELQSYSKKSHTHDYAAKSHNHDYAAKNHTHSAPEHNHNSSYVKGNYTITKSNGCFYIQ